MSAFLEAIGGVGFAILGAALTAGLCCVGSAKGTGMTYIPRLRGSSMYFYK